MYYKYLPAERITYLSDELLRFTQPSDLNDPFECLPQKPSREEGKKLVTQVAHNLIEKVEIEKYGKEEFDILIEKLLEDIEEGNDNNLLDGFLRKSRNKVNDNVGIFSLSKNCSNTLMWSHYTISHNGFCIGFDPTHPFFNIQKNDENFLIRDVRYSTDRAKYRMDINQLKNGVESFFTKSIDWQYEEEIRVVAMLNRAFKIILGNKFPINLFRVPHNSISEIILGANISTELKLIIIEFCSERNIPCYQSQISSIKYDMEKTLI
jgi:hypothetical protein